MCLNLLAREVYAARIARYPSRRAAADAGGTNRDPWRRAEEGSPVRPGTYAAIEKALGWEPGRCTQLRDTPPTAPTPVPPPRQAQIDTVRSILVEDTELPAADIRALTNRLLAALEDTRGTR